MKFRKSSLVSFLVVVFSILNGQSITILVTNPEGEYLVGAEVKQQSNNQLLAISDENGKAKIDIVRPVDVIVSYLGYTPTKVEIPKDLTEYNIVLTPDAVLDEIILTSPRVTRLAGQIRTFTPSEFNILPGSFDDPTRLLLKTPGISVSNDQNNSINYRGLPSEKLTWAMNGVYTVSPNHLSDAGQPRGIISNRAGGVNAIGAQTLDSMQFVGGARSQSSFGGLGSTRMYSSSIDRYVQASLLGFEAGYNYKGFSVGYRYSFTGLLANLGVDFGGEKIGFQDLNLRYNRKFGQHSLRLSHTSGWSSNIFEEEDVVDGDEVRYNGDLSITTLNYRYKRFFIDAGYSRRIDKKEEKYDSIAFSNEQATSLTHINTGCDISDLLTIGTHVFYEESIFSPYASINYNWKGMTIRPTFMAQLGYESSIGAMVDVSQQIDDLTLSLSAGYFNDLASELGLSYDVNNQHSFDVSLFYIESTFDSINQSYFKAAVSDFAQDDVMSRGVELAYSGGLDDNLSWFANTTLFDLTTTSDIIPSNDVGYMVNIGTVKSWQLRNDNFLRFTASWHQRGGEYNIVGAPYTRLSDGRRLVDTSNSNYIRLKDYYRVDARISYQTSRYVLSLDIQNVTNRMNDSFYDPYLSSVDGRSLVLEQQLGLLPVLSYRYYFR